MKTTAVLLLFLVFLVGCSHKPVAVAVPEAPPPAQAQQLPESANAGLQTNTEQPEFPLDAKPLWSETGIASWYGAPYHNRRASNGEIYDMHAMTAAHRTLPLGTIVRVTDIKTGSSALVRITDRGPFISGRVIDLSQSAASKIGIVQRGTAEVRIDVLNGRASVAAISHRQGAYLQQPGRRLVGAHPREG
jgi:rare lipoprotein A